MDFRWNHSARLIPNRFELFQRRVSEEPLDVFIATWERSFGESPVSALPTSFGLSRCALSAFLPKKHTHLLKPPEILDQVVGA